MTGRSKGAGSPAAVVRMRPAGTVRSFEGWVARLPESCVELVLRTWGTESDYVVATIAAPRSVEAAHEAWSEIDELATEVASSRETMTECKLHAQDADGDIIATYPIRRRPAENAGERAPVRTGLEDQLRMALKHNEALQRSQLLASTAGFKQMEQLVTTLMERQSQMEAYMQRALQAQIDAAETMAEALTLAKAAEGASPEKDGRWVQLIRLGVGTALKDNPDALSRFAKENPDVAKVAISLLKSGDGE